MSIKALAVFSGGLDSILAVRLVQEQGVDVAGLTFTTPFLTRKRPGRLQSISGCLSRWKTSRANIC